MMPLANFDDNLPSWLGMTPTSEKMTTNTSELVYEEGNALMQCVVIGALMSALVLSDQRNGLQSPVSTITVAKNA